MTSPAPPPIPYLFYRRLAQLYGLGSEGGRALDLLSGEGQGARALALMGYAVTAIEPRDDLRGAAARLTEGMDLDVSFQPGDPEATGFPGGHFAWILTLGRPDPPLSAAALRECRRLLTSGGRMARLLCTPLVTPGQPLRRLDLARAAAGLSTAARPDALESGWLDELVLAGFADVESGTLDLYVDHDEVEFRRGYGEGAGGPGPSPPLGAGGQVSQLYRCFYVTGRSAPGA